MTKKSLFITSALMVLTFQGALAFQPKETARYFNGPTVDEVTSTSARFSISEVALAGISEDEKLGLYFQYSVPCTAAMDMRSTEACIPKKTEVGKNIIMVTNLKPDTSYTVVYKRDSTIRCIKAPCPGNEFESLAVVFKTSTDGGISTTPATPTFPTIPVPVGNSDNVKITKNLSYRSKGEQVTTLQTILIQQGYLTGEPTGYFGILTLKAVKAFQKAHNINPTGFAGPATRGVLASLTSNSSSNDIAEVFEGTITAYSTACFADGECSITVDGKKVVTTIGWSQAIVGKVVGIPDFGSVENKVGAHAKVYAKKTTDGYTLYGSSKYYIEISQSQSKLPAGSSVTQPSAVQGAIWVWKETVNANSTVTPTAKDKFTILIGADGKISGTTDCNSFFGTTAFGSDGFIQVGPLGMTKMACQNSQESLFTNDLQAVTNYSINNTGILELKKGQTVMYFQKSAYAY